MAAAIVCPARNPVDPVHPVGVDGGDEISPAAFRRADRLSLMRTGFGAAAVRLRAVRWRRFLRPQSFLLRKIASHNPDPGWRNAVNTADCQ
jgi:hypothetical protein